MTTLKSFIGTVTVVGSIILLLLLVKGLSLIPMAELWTFVKSYWPGIIMGVVVSYLGVGINECIEKRRTRKRAKNKK